jgi:hypothetical protein
MSNTTAKFTAQIPDGMNAFQQGRDNVRVLLDIPRIFLPEAMKLMVMREGVLEVTVSYLGERHEVEQPQPEDAKPAKQGKGPHGQFWKHLKLAGFENCPGVREEIEDNRATEDADGFDILRLLFVVDSLSYVSPDEVKARFDSPQARMMVEQAQRKANEHSGSV